MSLKSPEAVLRAALVANADVQALLSGRIYPLRYTGSAKVQFPIAIWRRARILRTPTMGGPAGLPKVTVEFNYYGTTYESVRDLADKARRVLDGYAGQIENTVVRQATLEDEFDDLVEVEGSEESLYVVRQTYDVFWQEN